jgi:uncharacterized membrane protein YeaQ/YmgE (transglycosylase-associated protein family)
MGRIERAFRLAGLSALYAVVSGVVLDIFLERWGAELGAVLPSVLRFEGAKPYVYRVLSPAIVNAVVALIPERAGAALLAVHLPRSRAGANALSSALTVHRWPAGPSLSVLVGIWLMFAALWGTLWAWRALVACALPRRPLLASAAPAIGLLALPVTFVGGGFLYDFPDLFLVSVASLAFVRRRWLLWYALLPLVVLNKEASVLVVVWWLAALGTLPRRQILVHSLASAVLGASVVLGLWYAFRSAPGAVVQTNLLANLRYWASFRWAFASDDLLGLGLTGPVATHFLNLGLLLGVWAYGRRRVPRLVERLFLASVAAVAPLFLLFGFENEVRVFALAFPALFVLGVGAADVAGPTGSTSNRESASFGSDESQGTRSEPLAHRFAGSEGSP